MPSNEKSNPEKPQYRCAVCLGGPSEGLGKMQYAGRQVMETFKTNNPMAHRLCLPTYLRQNPRLVHGRLTAASAN